MDVLVVEWILDYERCLKQEGLNMSDDALLASMAIRDYLEKDLGFPKTPFKSWNEAANAKKKIDDIVIKYKSGTP